MSSSIHSRHSVRDDVSIASHRSETMSSTKPTDIILPFEIDFSDGTEEEGDDKSKSRSKSRRRRWGRRQDDSSSEDSSDDSFIRARSRRLIRRNSYHSRRSMRGGFSDDKSYGSTRSERSYHSTTSSHRSRARAKDIIEIDNARLRRHSLRRESYHSRRSIRRSMRGGLSDDRSNRSTRSERSYHSTTSSHRSRARAKDIIETDSASFSRHSWNESKRPKSRRRSEEEEDSFFDDVSWKDDENDELSIASHRSESSTKPSDIILPFDIELSEGAEEEGDDKSIGSLGSQSATSEAYSRGSRRQSRIRNSRRAGRSISRGRQLHNGRQSRSRSEFNRLRSELFNRRRSRSRNSRRPGGQSISSGSEGNSESDNRVTAIASQIYVENRQWEDPYGEKGIYTGEFFTDPNFSFRNKPHGKGRMEYEKEGRWYEGDWVNGKWWGNGTLSNGDGDFYEGGFELDSKLGEGTMKYADGGVYIGSWANDKRNGRGKHFHADGAEYEGGFKHDRKEGEGIMKYADGSIYTGSWFYGKRNGRGKHVYADGTEYEGDFRNDERHGEGTMKYADGGVYSGSWVDDKRHGKGKHVFADGSEYDGEYDEDSFHGHGQPLLSAADLLADGSLKHDSEVERERSDLLNATQAEDDTPVGLVGNQESGQEDMATPGQHDEYKPSTDTNNTVQNGVERARTQKHSLRPSADRFFSTLREYLSCRKTMETAFLQDPDMFPISKIEARSDSGGIEKDVGEGTHQYKPEFQQQSVAGTPAKSLDDLYEAANTVMPTFRKLVNNLARKACESKDEGDDDDAHQSPLVVISKKGRDRAQEKATDDYSRREPGPAVSWLYDIVRGSIKFHSAQQIERCIKILLEEDEYFIVKAKNRFMNPTLTGYRDFAVWIQVEGEQGFSHVCEIQIHHAGMKQLDSDLGSHKIYEYFRWFFAGAIGSLKDRLKDLEMISEGYELNDFSLDTFIKDCDDEERLERLALLFHEQMCEFHLALEIYEKLMQLRQAKYEMEDHIAIAKTFDSQAAVYRDMGQFDKALELHERCIRMYRGTSGMSLAATYQHMAVIKTETGFPKNALLLYQRSLDILSAMPPEATNADVDMSLADIYNNMGNTKRDLGLLDDAIALHEKSLRIKKENLGMEHSSVATSLNNMGIVRLKQGMVDEAISLFLEAMKVDQRFVGAEHASIAVTQGNLGLAYEQKGEFESARDMYGQALKQQRSILGLQHEEVAWTMENLARVHVKERDYDVAIELQEESLQMKTRIFGADHAEVITTSKMLDRARRKKSRGDSDDVDTLEHATRVKGREFLNL